jgi:hypothetical protein
MLQLSTTIIASLANSRKYANRLHASWSVALFYRVPFAATDLAPVYQFATAQQLVLPIDASTVH